MQTLNLTNEHKSKLIEMCKKLFPEYKYQELSDGTCDLCIEGVLHLGVKNPPTWNNYMKIHWYEFCIEYLLPKLAIKYYNYHRWCMEEGKIHLVDFIYKEYKRKIK